MDNHNLSAIALVVLMTLYFFGSHRKSDPAHLPTTSKYRQSFKNFPSGSPSRNPGIADGEKSSFVGLTYISSATLDELRKQLNSRQFQCYFSNGSQDLCKRSNADGSSIEVTLSPAPKAGATNVDVGFIDY